MKIRIAAGLLAAALVIMTGTAHAQDKPPLLNGLYCHKASIEQSIPADSKGKCPPSTTKIDGINACRAVAQNSQTMQLRENIDGTLDIGVSVWQDGFNCGVAGRALKTEKGWRLEKFINDPDPYAKCRIDISVAKDVLTLRTDPKAACRYACGVGIGLDGMQFPLNTSRTGPARDEVFRAEENVYTMVLCP